MTAFDGRWSTFYAGLWMTMFGLWARWSARRVKKIPAYVQRREPHLTLKEFNARNLRGTTGFTIVGLLLLVFGLGQAFVFLLTKA